MLKRGNEIEDRLMAVENSLLVAFGKIKGDIDELSEQNEDLRNSDNETFNEMHLLYEYISKLQSQVDKLNETVQEQEMRLRRYTGEPEIVKAADFADIKLTKNEQEVFQAIYSFDDDQGYATCTTVARRLCLPEGLVKNHVQSIHSKGVPIIREIVGNEVQIRLDPEFKSIQTKENILGISEQISHKVLV